MSEALPHKHLVGYADRMSVRPGDRLRFMVSCEETSAYHAENVRLESGDLHPQGPGFIEHPVATNVTGTYAGRFQPLHAGSYALVEGGIAKLTDFTLQAMIWPTSPGGRRQVILGQWSTAVRGGWALTLDEAGTLALELGDGASVAQVSSQVPLREREWAFVAASFEARTRRVRLYQEPCASISRAPAPVRREEVVSLTPAAGTGLPLTIAASTATTERSRVTVTDHLNGKIDSPRISGRVLDRAEMDALTSPASSLPPSVLAAWDFSLDMTSDRIVDRSRFRRHGRLVNLPARAMKGFKWIGEVFDWKQAPDQYGAIHFHDDDLYDAGWAADFELVVPKTLRSGVYAAKLTAGEEAEYIPFVVQPPRGAKTADAVVLIPTASYLAYANERAGLESGGRLHAFANHLMALGPGDLWLNDHPEVGGSLYDRHSDGSGVCYSSRLRPILNFRPGVTNAWIGAAGTAPWQFNADLTLISWLEARGIPYDVTTDEDLHEEGRGLLAPYRLALTGSHPEYYSKEMYDALTGFLENGGRLMYLGGNGFYWRIAFHRQLPGVIQLHRAEDGIRDWVAEGGEYYHSFTGEYGGMWSRMGRPIHALAGIGMAAQGFDVSSYYRRQKGSHDPRAAFIFDGIEEDVIGDFGTVGGGAAGLELDRCDVAQGSPPHALVLASSENHSDTYFPPPNEIHNASAMMDGRQNPNIRADMVFFETPWGGAIFSTGSIAWIGSLIHDQGRNNVSRITENVLRRFIDPARFRHPDTV